MTSETAGARSDDERLISLSLVGLLNNFMSCDHKILNIPDKLKISRVVCESPQISNNKDQRSNSMRLQNSVIMKLP